MMMMMMMMMMMILGVHLFTSDPPAQVSNHGMWALDGGCRGALS